MKYLESARNQILDSFKEHNCCLYAFLSALIGSTTTQFDGRILELQFVDNTQYLFIKRSLKSLYDDRVECVDGDFAGKKFVLIDGQAVSELMDDLGLELNNGQIAVNNRVIENDCCAQSFAKGCFVGAGRFYTNQDINAKSTGYNLEIGFNSEAIAKTASQCFNKFGVKMKWGNRLGRSILYLRDSEQICDLLTAVGAFKASLEFQNDLSLRTMKNNLNRQNNCYDANQTKTINASFEHIKAIENLQKSGKFEFLDADLKLIAQIRLDNPDASLSELCTIFPRKITRAGMKYKLDRLIAISQKKKDKK